MLSPTPNSGKRRIVRGVIIAAVLGIISLASLFMASRGTPTWYEPPVVDDAMAEDARRSLSDAYQQFTDAVVAGEPFTYRISEKTVNTWLAARERMWPAAADTLPSQIDSPMVAFRDGNIAVAARVKLTGLWTVVSMRSSAHADDHWLVVGPITILAGSVPMPLRTVGSIIDKTNTADLDLRNLRHLADPTKSIHRLTDLINGFAIRNELYWANGERYFRITGINAENGWLTISVEPIP